MAPKGGKGGGGGSRSGSGSSSSSSRSSCSSSAFADWYPIASISILGASLLVILIVNYLHSGIKKKKPLINGPLGGGFYALAMFFLLVGVTLGIVAYVMRECERSSSFSGGTSSNLAIAYGAIYGAGVLMIVAVFMIPLAVALLHRAQKSSQYIKTAKTTSYVFLSLLFVFFLAVVAMNAGTATGTFGGLEARIGIQTTYDFLIFLAVVTSSGVMIAAMAKMRSHGTTPKGTGFWFSSLIAVLVSMTLLNVIQDLGWYVQHRSFTRISNIVFLAFEFFFISWAVIAVLYAAASLNWSELDVAAAKEGRLGARPNGGVMGEPGKGFDEGSTGTSPMPQHSIPAGAYVVTPQNQSWNGSYQAVPQSDAPAFGQPQYLMAPAGTAAPQQQQQGWAYQPVSQQQQQSSPVYPSPQPGWQQQQNVYQAPQQQQFHPGLSGTPVQGQGHVVR